MTRRIDTIIYNENYQIKIAGSLNFKYYADAIQIICKVTNENIGTKYPEIYILLLQEAAISSRRVWMVSKEGQQDTERGKNKMRLIVTYLN